MTRYDGKRSSREPETERAERREGEGPVGKGCGTCEIAEVLVEGGGYEAAVISPGFI